MLEQILREIRNYFIRDVWAGDFRIIGGTLDVDFLQENQYFKISGSLFNDGVYQYPDADFDEDEEFTGEVWALAIPPGVISLIDEIEEWTEKNANILKSPFVSESFGGYSYTKQSGSSSNNGSGNSGVSWKTVFADRLNEWRKARYEFVIRRHDYVRNA